MTFELIDEVKISVIGAVNVVYVRRSADAGREKCGPPTRSKYDRMHTCTYDMSVAELELGWTKRSIDRSIARSIDP